MFSVQFILFVCLFVCVFVCQQDYAHIAEPIFLNLSRRLGHGPRKKLLTFEVNPGWMQVEQTNKQQILHIKIRILRLYICIMCCCSCC